MSDHPEKEPGKLWRRTKSKWLLTLPLGAFLMFGLGAVALFVFNTVIHASSTNEFCYGCHIGMDTIVEEYQASVHFSNRSGVKADCADCHVPKEFIPMMKVKIFAISDIYHKLAGTITLENFEEKRPALAQKVWDEMKSRNSKECMNCHAFERMNPELQSKTAARRHNPDRLKGKTCIDCHTGIAHALPKLDLDAL